MKKFLFSALAIMLVAGADAQSTAKTDVKESRDRFANIEVQYVTTTELPEGTTFNKGKVALKKGYRANYLDSNRVIVVQKPNGETSGAFKCRCSTGSSGGSCSVTFSDGMLYCVASGGCSCTMDVIVKPPKNAAITQSGGNWKKLIVPAANTQKQNTEDPDQGGEIFKKNKKTAASSSKQ